MEKSFEVIVNESMNTRKLYLETMSLKFPGMQLEIFNMLKKRLPDGIKEDILYRVTSQCLDRIKLLMENEDFLRGMDVFLDETWGEDIHITNFEVGVSWIFDKNTGQLHTT